VLLATTIASARPLPPEDARGMHVGQPHPAVVRVIAPGRDSLSCGSGTLVAVDASRGLVITNWHVVCEATGPVTVVFPDGFRSGATIARWDRDWDLAALWIWRPQADPVALAHEAPRPGEPLTIAGYGSSRYRAASGRCTQYVAPAANLPYEMVELSAAARQGDSGGPIFNHRGELAGVLFGTAQGRTTGSYCGRVRWFLTPLMQDLRQPGPADTMLAERPKDNAPPAPPASAAPPQPSLPIAAIAATGPDPTAPNPTPPASALDQGWRHPPTHAPALAAPPARAAAPAAPLAENADFRWQQIKDILAAVGMVAILFHALRLVGRLQTA